MIGCSTMSQLGGDRAGRERGGCRREDEEQRKRINQCRVWIQRGWRVGMAEAKKRNFSARRGRAWCSKAEVAVIPRSTREAPVVDVVIAGARCRFGVADYGDRHGLKGPCGGGHDVMLVVVKKWLWMWCACSALRLTMCVGCCLG